MGRCILSIRRKFTSLIPAVINSTEHFGGNIFCQVDCGESGWSYAYDVGEQNKKLDKKFHVISFLYNGGKVRIL